MRETRWDDSEVLTDSVNDVQLRAAMQAMRPAPAPRPAEQNRAVALHAPGSVVKLADGAEYRIGPKGNWIRLNQKPSKKARRRQ
jgi:hypothetical protein